MSSFVRSKDMALAQNVEMGHETLIRPFGQSFTWPTHVQNLKSLAVAFAEIFRGV